MIVDKGWFTTRVVSPEPDREGIGPIENLKLSAFAKVQGALFDEHGDKLRGGVGDAERELDGRAGYRPDRVGGHGHADAAARGVTFCWCGGRVSARRCDGGDRHDGGTGGGGDETANEHEDLAGSRRTLRRRGVAAPPAPGRQ